MSAPANHRGRILTPRLPTAHSGDDPLPNGTLDETKGGDHRIWVEGEPRAVTPENLQAAGWTQVSGSWFPPS